MKKPIISGELTEEVVKTMVARYQKDGNYHISAIYVFDRRTCLSRWDFEIYEF